MRLKVAWCLMVISLAISATPVQAEDAPDCSAAQQKFAQQLSEFRQHHFRIMHGFHEQDEARRETIERQALEIQWLQRELRRYEFLPMPQRSVATASLAPMRWPRIVRDPNITPRQGRQALVWTACIVGAFVCISRLLTFRERWLLSHANERGLRRQGRQPVAGVLRFTPKR